MDEPDELSLLIDLHRDGERQGPGGDDETRLAIALAGLSADRNLRIAEIVCGTGAATRVLAHELDATVTAVDRLPAFIRDLNRAPHGAAHSGRIETVIASMDALPFATRSFDAIWSEGAIYNMGFTHGIRAWHQFLKPNGILAVSELTWLTQARPAALQDHWLAAYAEVDTAAAKMTVLQDNGYSPVGYFTLPQRCWLNNYYHPLQARSAEFLARNKHSTAAKAIVAAEEHEIALYERYAAFVGYGYFIARKIAD